MISFDFTDLGDVLGELETNGSVKACDLEYKRENDSLFNKVGRVEGNPMIKELVNHQNEKLDAMSAREILDWRVEMQMRRGVRVEKAKYDAERWRNAKFEDVEFKDLLHLKKEVNNV